MLLKNYLIATVDWDDTPANVELLQVPQYAKDDAIGFFWSATEQESTLLQWRYGLHRCLTDTCETEGCEPNVCIEEAKPCPVKQPPYTAYLNLPPVYEIPESNQETPVTASLINATRYRIAFNMVNEAKVSGITCSSPILVDKNPPVIDSLTGPGECLADLHSFVFTWDGHDGEGESGLSSAQYAVGTQPKGEDVVPYTYIPINQHTVTVSNLLLKPGQTYYLTFKLKDNAGWETMQYISFMTAANWNAQFISTTLKKVFMSDLQYTITFKNHCGVNDWQPGEVALQIVRKDTNESTLIPLDEIISKEASKEFTIALPGNWTDVPIGYVLEFRMMHATDGFGDTVDRQMLVNPYMKVASWNKFANQDSDLISVYFKSSRSDADIDILTMRCNQQSCDEAAVIETVPSYKALFQVFAATSLDGKLYGELRLYYVPHTAIALSDKDIIASFSNSYYQGNNLKGTVTY
jgi:hypothetical protein